MAKGASQTQQPTWKTFQILPVCLLIVLYCD